MNPTIQPLRGMNDVLPADMPWWHFLEATAREVLDAYGYQEVRLPLLEQTALFKRAIGEYTDIVEKEMFTFADRDGDSLTLRPEATASLVRAAITNGLLHNQRHRLWTAGPMFRGERPQKGRYRQFHQIDVEAYGFAGPDIDAELILLSARLWQRLGISRVRLELNSLGTPESRRLYREQLIGLQQSLTDAGIAFTVNPRLVRGLDYSTRTVFEWITDALGSQNAVCSGGRFDGLIPLLGGEPTPAIGWALGEERIVLLMQELGIAPPGVEPDVFVVVVGDRASRAGLAVAERLRDSNPGLKVHAGLGGGGFKAQFKRADQSGATVAVIIGDDEADRGKAPANGKRAGNLRHCRRSRPRGGIARCARREIGRGRLPVGKRTD